MWKVKREKAHRSARKSSCLLPLLESAVCCRSVTPAFFLVYESLCADLVVSPGTAGLVVLDEDDSAGLGFGMIKCTR